jgi:hypothetical protein
MTVTWLRSTPAVATALAFCLLASPPVPAAPPEKILPFEEYYEPAFMTSCQPYGFSFDIWSGATFYGFGKWFPKKEGGGRLDLHFKTDDVFINEMTGKTIVGHARFRQSIDFSAGDVKLEFSGLFFHVVVPGVGNVLQDAGRMVIDLETGQIEFMKGTYQWNVGDFEELCAALE